MLVKNFKYILFSRDLDLTIKELMMTSNNDNSAIDWEVSNTSDLGHIVRSSNDFYIISDISANTNFPISDLNINRKIYNNSRYDITIIDRNGIPFIIKANGHGHSLDSIDIHIEYTWQGRTHIDPNAIFEDTNGGSQLDNELVNQINTHRSRDLYASLQPSRMECCYRIYRSQLPLSKGLYLKDLDLVINATNLMENNVHPSATNSLSFQLFEQIFKRNEDVFDNTYMFCAFIVSNGADRSRYMRLGNDIVKIPCLQRSGLQEGLYVCTRTDDELTEEGKFNFSPIPLEQAEKRYYLYDTYKLASLAGAPHEEKKRKAEERRAENRMNEERNNKARRRQEKKDEVRVKFLNELAKWGPVIVGNILTILTLILGKKGKA